MRTEEEIEEKVNDMKKGLEAFKELYKNEDNIQETLVYQVVSNQIAALKWVLEKKGK